MNRIFTLIVTMLALTTITYTFATPNPVKATLAYDVELPELINMTRESRVFFKVEGSSEFLFADGYYDRSTQLVMFLFNADARTKLGTSRIGLRHGTKQGIKPDCIDLYANQTGDTLCNHGILRKGTEVELILE
tara:strand:+ start:38017 stop:38418 length:402 start_codon:yes stop_codon:yes gene_type:complete